MARTRHHLAALVAALCLGCAPAALAAPFTAHGVLVAKSSTTSQVTSTAAGTSGQCLTSNGASSDPTYQTCAVVNSGTAGQAAYYASSGAAVSGISQKSEYIWTVPSNVTVANGTTIVESRFPWSSGAISSVDYLTAGSSTPSFTASVEIGGTPVTSCSALSVSSSTNTNVACTGADTLASGNAVEVVISGVSGSPTQAVVKVNFTHTVN